MHFAVGHLRVATAILIAAASQAAADQAGMFETACLAPFTSFDERVANARAAGWNDATAKDHPILTTLARNYGEADIAYGETALFIRKEADQTYLLILLSGENATGLDICKIVAPDATVTLDQNAFQTRFDPLAHSELRWLTDINARFFPDVEAMPIPPYAGQVQKRPKMERGLRGQVMTATNFTQ